MKSQTFKYFLRFIIIFVFPLHFTGCASFGPTKPNLPYAGNPYPPILIELAQKNPLLVQELGKLPELQDGISETEIDALKNIVEMYNFDQVNFEKTFNEMYKIGLPEFRKYCSPLQALFWLAEENKLSNYNGLISNYSLIKLLNKAWKFNPLSYRLLSDKQIKEVIDGIEIEDIRRQYLDYMQKGYTYYYLQDSFVLDYRRSKNTHMQTFSIKSAKIIEENLLTPKSSLPWKDHKIIIDRLNAPELLDFYINSNITYDHKIPGFHRSPRSVINEKYGDCDDLAYFGRTILTKAGYDVFGRIVGDESIKCHIGLGIRLEEGSYLLAVNFDSRRNHMSGPHKTILELDQALGYGYSYRQRGPFTFDW